VQQHYYDNDLECEHDYAYGRDDGYYNNLHDDSYVRLLFRVYGVHDEVNDEHDYYNCKVHDDGGHLHGLHHALRVHVLLDGIQSVHARALGMSKDNVYEVDV
tara:strand:- start:75 stop:380 length:306 start_codon:yes stop_codon:yes gene_type:complete